MTVNAQSRPPAFDISQFFAPEIISPTKRKKTAMVFSGTTSKDNDDFTYGLSKHLDFPVQCHFERPHLAREPPRGIPWHNFPVVSDPYYRISLGTSHRSADFSVNGEKPTSESLLDKTDVFVFRNNGTRRECAVSAYEMAYALEKFGQGGRSVLVDDAVGAFVSTPVLDLKKPMNAELRFLYSYMVNFTAIATKALRAVGADGVMHPSEFSSIAKIRLCGFQDTPWWSRTEIASHPLALQWLLRLRSLGSFDVSYASEYNDFVSRVIGSSGQFNLVTPYSAPLELRDSHLEAVALLRHDDGKHTLAAERERENDPDLTQLRMVLRRKGVEVTSIGTTARVIQQLRNQSSGDSGRFFSLDHAMPTAWKGTGKHPPLAVSDHVAQAPLSFIGMKLVCYDECTRTISLSDKGHRFLDLLHPDCQDPDVMLRWTGDDGLFREGVEQSCDDWIMRFFSKMKTRVNEIEA
jgi:hypothetical protein